MTATFSDPPSTAAWQRRDARSGFEVAFRHTGDDSYRLEGHTAALEHGQPWAVAYVITLDRDWLTMSAYVRGHRADGPTCAQPRGSRGRRLDDQRRTTTRLAHLGLRPTSSTTRSGW
jgi:Putative glycolipid-binding